MQSSIDAQTSLYYGIDKYCGRLEHLMQLKQGCLHHNERSHTYSCIFPCVMPYDPLPSRMLVQPPTHIIHFALDDDPAVVGLLVHGDLAPRVAPLLFRLHGSLRRGGMAASAASSLVLVGRNCSKRHLCWLCVWCDDLSVHACNVQDNDIHWAREHCITMSNQWIIIKTNSRFNWRSIVHREGRGKRKGIYKFI